jgi:hypothetical protein
MSQTIEAKKARLRGGRVAHYSQLMWSGNERYYRGLVVIFVYSDVVPSPRDNGIN